MNERHSLILRELVRLYIATGRPVASSQLASIISLGVSPATVRHALVDLEEEGFLSQPHVSAGRVPTDQGYRHYVNSFSTPLPSTIQKKRIKRSYNELSHQHEHSSRVIAKLLSQLTQAVVISAYLKNQDIQDAGLHDVLRTITDSDMPIAREISMLIDDIDQHLTELAESTASETRVFIGQENPFFPVKHTSLLIRSTTLPSGDSALLIVAGPKRMSYRRNLSLLEGVADLIHNQ